MLLFLLLMLLLLWMDFLLITATDRLLQVFHGLAKTFQNHMKS